MPDVARGITCHNYASDAQTDLSTQKELTADHALKLLKQWEITPVQSEEVREDYHPDTRSPVEATELDQGPHEVSAESYLIGCGTQGTAPDLTDVYKTAFSETTDTATTQNGAAADTTHVTPTSDNWTAGQLIKVAGEGGSAIEHRWGQIYSVSTGVYTIWPPLATLLGDTDDIKATCNYELENNNQNAITIGTVDEQTQVVGIGAIFPKFDFTFPAKGSPTIAISGQCRDILRGKSTTLNGAINDSVTTVVLTKAIWESGSVVLCESEYILLGDTTDNLTFTSCTRGYGTSSAAAHDDAKAVTPYSLTDSTKGSVIQTWTTWSGVWLGDSSGASSVYVPGDMDVTISIDEKGKLEGYYGDGGKMADKTNSENREITLSLSGYVDDDMMQRIIEIVNYGNLRFFLQAGHTDGRSFAVGMPKVKFKPPTFGDVKGDRRKVTLESFAVLYDSTNSINALTFAF